MIIDSHAHLVPPDLIEEIKDVSSNFPSIEIISSNKSISFSFLKNKSTRPISNKLFDVQERINWMDKQNITLQVVGGWVDMFGYQIPVEEGIRWSEMINRHLKVFSDQSNGRFLPLATLPMQDGKAAAMVLDDIHKQGFKGVMIGTQPKGVGGVLDDPSLTPFWESADKNRSILFIHPMFDSGDTRVDDYGMNNAVGRITDTMIAVSRIIYSGHIERYRNARVVIGMGGAGLPYIIGRLSHNFKLHEETLCDPKLALSSMYYDTVIHDPSALSFLIEKVGYERVMLGSDMPFPIGDLQPKNILKNLENEKRLSILFETSKKLFSL
tara:strand:+ start:149 stop:1123 length:975 start_codon:yes stop_codon:yes gene_type:complete